MLMSRRSRSTSKSLCLLLLICRLSTSLASMGDADFTFRRCVSECEATGCASIRAPQGAKKDCSAACPQVNRSIVPRELRALQWSCTDDCRYRCMSLRKLHTIDGLDGSKCKYFGKWPFQRFLGIQELFSVVFSLANLAAHAHNLHRLYKAKHNSPCFASKAARSDPAWGLWTAYALGSINAWWWSAVFHSRDTYFTERLDYLSADVSIMIGLYVSFSRVFGLRSMMPRILCSLVLSAGTAAHFWYMLFVKFDYGFNVKLCILIGVLQQVMWCSWAVIVRHPSRQRLIVFVLLINAALSLEVLDFPPIAGLLDAHALWHLCTVPLIYLWYSFVFTDIEWEIVNSDAAVVQTKDL